MEEEQQQRINAAAEQFAKLPASPGCLNGLERFFERFPGPFGGGPRLAVQDLDRHVAYLLLVVHGDPLLESSLE